MPFVQCRVTWQHNCVPIVSEWWVTGFMDMAKPDDYEILVTVYSRFMETQLVCIVTYMYMYDFTCMCVHVHNVCRMSSLYPSTNVQYMYITMVGLPC